MTHALRNSVVKLTGKKKPTSHAEETCGGRASHYIRPDVHFLAEIQERLKGNTPHEAEGW